MKLLVARCDVTMSPAVLNMRSLATEVAWVHRYSFANLDINRKLALFEFHQSSGFLLKPIDGSCYS